MGNLRVVGVLVVFDTQRNPAVAIDAMLGAVDHLVIVDNSPSGHPGLAATAGHPRVSLIANGNRGGLAGAYNATVVLIEERMTWATHVLFLDDDSDTTALTEFLCSDITLRLACLPDVAAVAPAYVERETGLRGAHLRLRRFRFNMVPRHVATPTEVTFLINSMSLWRLAAIRQIGRYDERLMVDHVDTDYCLRAQLVGLRLFLNPAVSFVHSIGRRRSYRFLGWVFQSGGHSPARRQRIGFNTAILARTYLGRMPSFAFLCGLRIGYEMLGIVMAEDCRLKKLAALAKGTLAGLFALRE